ncbi:MAG: DUF5076 domain-containing protein [Candidatus Competibacteraceae bacterium]|nr:DUF5076 domain-containing protein [Candidatus Competibacteraceae bacterium]
MNDELSLPKQVTDDPLATEVLRVWLTGDTQTFILRSDVWDDPAAWGILLVDLARHLANSYTATSGNYQQVIDRIRAGFDAEWDHPTDDAEWEDSTE